MNPSRQPTMEVDELHYTHDSLLERLQCNERLFNELLIISGKEYAAVNLPILLDNRNDYDIPESCITAYTKNGKTKTRVVDQRKHSSLKTKLSTVLFKYPLQIIRHDLDSECVPSEQCQPITSVLTQTPLVSSSSE